MTERLNNIEAQQATNTSNIANLIAMSANLMRAVEVLSERSFESVQRIEENNQNIREGNRRIEESNQRFEILRQEAIEDRSRSDERFEESKQRFEILRQEAAEERSRSDERFDRMILEIRRLGDRNS